ncbi:MAG: ATP-binding cassette domain-containing protein, partial [Proteobacteria bacterium]|nr:ATP-binding cassette domain-containing protein [Pseudomonadota bacterium]
MKNVILKANKLVRDVEGPSGTLRILDNVSLAIAKGSSIAITGPSGSGKSTLISLLAGMDLPSQGEVFIGDQDLNLLDEDGRARLRAGRVG